MSVNNWERDDKSSELYFTCLLCHCEWINVINVSERFKFKVGENFVIALSKLGKSNLERIHQHQYRLPILQPHQLELRVLKIKDD